MALGRPAKQLPEGWEETCLELAKKGKGLLHMAQAMGMARSTLYKKLDDDKDFSDTMALIKQEYEIWWENTGQEGMFMGGKDNPFNGALWSFNMKNRFGWTDKQEVQQDITSKGDKVGLPMHSFVKTDE